MQRSQLKARLLLKYAGRGDLAERLGEISSQAGVVDRIREHFSQNRTQGAIFLDGHVIHFKHDFFYPIAYAMLLLCETGQDVFFNLLLENPCDSMKEEDVVVLSEVVKYFPIEIVLFPETIRAFAAIPRIFSEASQTISNLYFQNVPVKVLECVVSLVEEGKFPNVKKIEYEVDGRFDHSDHVGLLVSLFSNRSLVLDEIEFTFNAPFPVVAQRMDFFTSSQSLDLMSSIRQHQRSLKCLRLTGPLNSSHLPCILDVVKKSLTIREFALSYNLFINESHVDSIMRAIRGHISLARVDLSENRVSQEKQEEVERLVTVSHALRSQILVALMSALQVPRLRARSPLRVLSVELVRRLGLFLGDGVGGVGGVGDDVVVGDGVGDDVGDGVVVGDDDDDDVSEEEEEG